MFDFVFQLVQVTFLTTLEMVIVRMSTTMMAVALTVVTVVDPMSLLLTASNVNAWEKISRAHLHQELFVLAQWKVQ